MNRKTLAEAAKEKGVTRQRMLTLAQQGRIPGARLEDGRYTIPANWTVTKPPKRNRGLDKLGG